MSYRGATLTNIGTFTCATWQIQVATFNFTQGTINPSVSVVLTSGGFNYNGGTLGAVPLFTHTAGTFTLGNSYALTAAGLYTFNGGQLNLGNYTLSTGRFIANGGATLRYIDFSTSSLLQITGNNATVLDFTTLSGYTGTVNIACTYVGSVGTRTFIVGSWTQSTAGTAAFDFKCNPCVGIQVYGAATDTISVDATVLNFDLTGMNFTFTQVGMIVYGDYTIPATGGSITATASTTTFASTSATARTITISRSIDFQITINGVGGTFQLGAALTVTGATRIFSFLNGTLSLNGYNLTLGYFSSNNSNTRTINFGSNSITVNGTVTPWDTTITTGLTVTGSRTVNVTSPGVGTISLVNGATEANAFDFNFSGTTTVNFLQNAGLAARNVDFTGFTGTLNTTAAVTIYGSYKLSAGMTVIASSNIMTFGATSGTNIITTNTRTMPPMAINGVGGTFNLGSSLTSSGAIQVLAGTFDTTATNYAVVCTAFDSSAVTNTRAINLNGSTITVSGTAGVTLNEVNLTFTSGTSQLTLSNATSTVLSFIGTTTFRNVSFTGGAPSVTIVGTNTYNNLTFTNGSAAPSVATITGSQTVSGTLSNTSTNATTRLQLQSSVSGTQITLSAGTVSLSDVDFKDIAAAGTVPFTGTRLGNLGNNTNITFSAGVNKYWNLAAGGNWNAIAWATSSGGTVDVNNFPLAQDTCIIENTGLNTSAIITMNANWAFGTLTMSTRTNAMTLAIGTTLPVVTGNWTNGSGTTLTGTGTVNFKNTGTTQVITPAGITFTPNINYESVGGTFQLAAALTLGTTSRFTLTKGTLSLNGFTLTTGEFFSDGSFTRSIAFGTTNIVLVQSNAANTVLYIPSLSNFSTSGTGQFTSAMSVTRIFNTGTLGSVSGSLAFNGTNQYASISYGQGGSFWSGTLALGNTFTIESWIYLTSTPSTGAAIAALWGTTSAGGKSWSLGVNSSLQLVGDYSSTRSFSGGSIPLNTWTHVAWVGTGTDQLLFINGVQVATAGRTASFGNISTSPLYIGARADNATSPNEWFFPGNISNLRVVNTVQVYTGTFTPPVSPLNATQSSGTNISAITAVQTKLLLNTPSNASSLTDSSTNNFSLTSSGTSVALTPITVLPAAGTPPSLALTSGAAIPTFATGSYFTNLDFTGSTSTPAASQITVNGNLTLATGGTYTSLGVTMGGTGTITPLAKTIAAFTVNTTGTVTLAAAFGCTSFTMSAGTFNLATFNLTDTGTATFSSGTLSNIGTITCTTWTTQGIFAHTAGTITPSVSFVLASGSYTQTGTSVLSAVPLFTQTAGSVTFRSTYSLTATGTYTLTAGTLTLGGNLTTGIFNSSGTSTRSVAFGAFNIVLAHTTAAQTVLGMADLTNFTHSYTGFGGFASGMSVTRTFTCGTTAGATASSVPNLYLNSGLAVCTLTNGSSFNKLDFTANTSSPASTTISIFGTLVLAGGGGSYSALTVNMVGATGSVDGSGSTTLLGLNINTSGTVQLLSALTLTALGVTTLTSGNLNLNGFTLTTGRFSSNNTSTRSITFGTANIILATTAAGAVNLDMADATNFTCTSSGTYGSGTGCFGATMSATRTFTFGTTGGSAINSPRLYLVSGASIATLTTGSWFKEVFFGSTSFTSAATTLNVSSIYHSGSTAVLTAVTWNMVGSGSFNSSGYIGNIVINTAGVTTTIAGSSSCTTVSLTLGTLDLNSQLLICSSTFTWNGGSLLNFGTLQCTTFTLNGPTLNLTAGTLSPTTSFVLNSGSFTYGGTATLGATTTFTQNTGTVTFNKSYALNTVSTYTLTSGSLTLANGVTLSTGIFSSTGTGTRSIGFGATISSGSAQFNGTSQTLTTTGTTSGPLDLATGAPDWTVECWFNANSVASNQAIFWKGGAAGTVNPSYCLQILAGGQGQWFVGNGSTGGYSQNITTFVANTWYHFALVRSGATLTAYVNGVAQAAVTIVAAIGNTSNNILSIGSSAADGSTRYFGGKISNFRIVKGVAVYTGTFFPSGPLTSTQSSGTNISAITGSQTSLLLNTVNGSGFLIDSSTFATTITNVGATTSSPLNPFSGPGNINLTHTTAATVVLSMADLTNYSYTGPGGFTVADMGNTRTFSYGNSVGSAATAINLTFTTGASAITISNGGWFNTLDYGTTTSTSTGTSINIVGSLLLNGTYTAMTFIMLGTGNLNGGASSSLLNLNIQTTGTITMTGNLTMLATGTVTLTQGSLVLNGFTLTTGIFSSTGTGFTRSVNFGSTNIVLAHTTAGTVVLNMADLTLFTYTGTGGFASSMDVTRTFYSGFTAGGSSSTAINLSLTGGAAVPTITTGGWFKNLDFTGNASIPAITTLNIVGNLTLATGGAYTNLSATMLGTSTITPAGKTIAAFVVNTSGTITLAAAFGSTTYNQTLGTMNFATFNMTCSSIVTYTGGTLSNIGTLTCTTFTTNGPTFAHSSGTITPSVSFVLTSGSYTQTGTSVLSAVPTFTHTAGSVTFRSAYALTATGTYTFTSGALTLGGNLTTGIFNTNSQLFRSIAFGTNNIVLAHTTAAQTVLNMPDIVNYSQTGTGGFTSAMSVTRTFTSGIQMGIPGSISYSGVQSSLVATNTVFAHSTNIDFTWEAWVFTSISATGGAIFNNQNTVSDNSGASAFVVGGQAYWYNLGLNAGAGGTFGTTAAGSIPDNTWTHVVFQRRGTAFEIYINGTLASTYTPSTPINMGATSQRFYIGRDNNGFYTGRLTNIRVVNGTAVYTGNFTPSTLPLSAAQSSGTNISALTGFNTSLMLNAARGAPFTDSSINGFALTQVGPPTTNTSSPFPDAYYGQYPNLSITSGASVATFTASSLFNKLDFTGSTSAPSGTVSINNLTLDTASSYTGLGVICVGTGSIIQNNKTLSSLEVKNGYVGGTVTIVTNPLATGSYTQTSGTIDFSSTSLTLSGVYTYVSGTLLNLVSIIGGTLVVTGTYDFSSGTINPSAITVISPGVFTYGGTATITAGSVATFTQTSGSVNLNKDLTLAATGAYTLTSGALTLGGNLTTGIFASNNTNVRSIAFSTYNIVLAHTTAATVVLNLADLTNFSYTGTGGFTSAMSVTRTFNVGNSAGATTLNAPNLSITSGASIPSINSGSLFNKLDFTGSTCTPATAIAQVNSVTLASGGTYTNLSITTIGTGTIISNGKTLSTLVVNNGAGTTTLSGALGVSTYTQTAGTIDFASYNLTCSSTALYTTGTLNNIGTISCTTFTVNGTFAHSTGTITPSLSFIITGGSYTQSGTSVLSSVAIFTQTASNVTFRSTYSLTATGTYTLTTGTLTLGGNLTTGIFSSTGTGVRSVSFSTFNIVLAHTSSATTVLNMADVTNFSSTGTGGFAADASVTRIYTFGTTAGSITNSANLSLTGSGPAIGTFTTGSWFNVLDFGTTAFAVPTTSLNINGLTLSATGTYTSLTITARGTGTITTRASYLASLIINNSSGTTTIGGPSVTTNSLTITTGTLDCDSKNVVVGGVGAGPFAFNGGSLINLGTLICGAASIATTYNFSSGTIFPIISFTVTTGGVFTYGGTAVFNGTYPSLSFVINGGSSVTLNTSLTLASDSTFDMTAGGSLTLADGVTLSTGIFLASYIAAARSIAFGSTSAGNIQLTHPTAGTTVLDITNTTSFTWTGPGGFTVANMGNTRTFTVGTTGGSSAIAVNLTFTTGASVGTLTTGSWFNNLNFGTTSFNPGTTSLNIDGNLTLSSSGTYTSLTATYVGSGTITSNGRTLSALTIGTSSITVATADALSISNALTLTAGTLNISSFNLTSATFASTGTLTRTITGSGTYSLTGSGATVFSNASATGITITGIIISMTSASAKTFAGGGASYPLLNQGGAGALTISGNNTFGDLSATTKPSSIIFTAGSTQTFTDFTLSGTAGNLITLTSTVPGTLYTLTRPTGVTNVNYLNIRDSSATSSGTGSWYANNSLNNSNNIGWIFTNYNTGAFFNFFFFN